MALFEPVGEVPSPSAAAGFVPCQLEDDFAQLLLRPLFDNERETLLLAAFDPFERLVRLKHVEGDMTGRCVITPHCWRALLDSSIAAVLMAHNHPSDMPWPSDADIAATHDAAFFLRTAGIDLVDHLIFVAGGHFSFRTAEML
ncbi:DNA repair protein RadC [Sphingopyxis sp. YR583]|uniref:JAB domain-containing protein n=1 Tax=Sphingopyxis sp. YR583 TaxID=1881047 RepID=UPI0008A7B432|nr:JAB domain-containing protein [Sphingopyxis sp. YR583]SEH18325.1 DNA repair protein RadC [Sphingopyxis sp. YR583]